jgi:hypothetical protein
MRDIIAKALKEQVVSASVNDDRLAELIDGYHAIDQANNQDTAAALTELTTLRRQLREAEAKLAAAVWLIPDHVLCGTLREKRDRMHALASQSKWLRMAADEIANEGHAGWGNTCTQAADAIDSALKELV